MSFITDNVASVLSRVDKAARAAGKSPSDITVVAATKMNGCAQLREAISAGITVCGENRVQELLEKASLGAYSGSRLHFIGHLQKNKVRSIVGRVELIQSIDSAALLREVDRLASAAGILQDVLLEINIGEEASKSGFLSVELSSALELAASLSSVHVRGIMAIPPICENPENNMPYFSAMHQLFVDNSAKKYDNVDMDFVSMGMSGDFEVAIACGSNMIRVGSGIFGPRNYKQAEVPANGLNG